jgi:AraC-like DNA-binding protein
MRSAPSMPGIERAEVFFAGGGFAPHRHDVYGIGVTLQGVQAFRYRGGAECSVPGQVFVLHPDELHDGRAATEAGLRYSILYIEPRLIGAALGDGSRALPFVRDVVSNDRRLAASIRSALADFGTPWEEMKRDQILLELAEALAACDGSTRRTPITRPHIKAVDAARAFLETCAHREVSSMELESITGLSRFELARHFRAHFGTSPHRYLVLRRLDRARAMLRGGASLAESAFACGFADQSHMTRHFKKAYGLSPGRWAALIRSPGFTVA